LARRLDVGPALQALQPRYLLALLDDGLAQSRNAAQKLLDESFELVARQRISIDRVRHSENESGIRVLGNPLTAQLQGNRAKNFWTIRASSESSKPLIRQSEDCGGEFG
jgi:hypothetical protein